MRTTMASVIAALLATPSLFAQAWVPPKGDGTVAIVYQNQLVRDHLFSDGGRIDVGHITSNGVLLDFAYGITDKLAFDVNIPYLASAYRGPRPHPGSVLDDGRIHGTFQDFRVDVRYNVAKKVVVITPFVDFIVPSHDYAYYGHAAPGRRLAEIQIGTYIGHVVTRGLPGAFLQARLSYGFAQQPLGRYHDRSNADAEIGYFLNPRLRVFALTATQYTWGGIVMTRDFPRDLTTQEFLHHDQIARADLVDVGFGAQLQINRRTNVVGSYATTIVGRNGHALGRSLTLGVSWSFGRSFDGGQLIADAEVGKKLPRCLCQKGKSAQ